MFWKAPVERYLASGGSSCEGDNV